MINYMKGFLVSISSSLRASGRPRLEAGWGFRLICLFGTRKGRSRGGFHKQSGFLVLSRTREGLSKCLLGRKSGKSEVSWRLISMIFGALLLKGNNGLKCTPKLPRFHGLFWESRIKLHTKSHVYMSQHLTPAAWQQENICTTRPNC